MLVIIHPDGRCANTTFKALPSLVIDTFHSRSFQGTVQGFGGLFEAGISTGLAYGSGGLLTTMGLGIMAHGLDQSFAGISTAFGYEEKTFLLVFYLDVFWASDWGRFLHICITLKVTQICRNRPQSYIMTALIT